MADTKNLCAQISIDLHERVSEERERLGQTTSEYIANLIQEYYNMIENQKSGISCNFVKSQIAPQPISDSFPRINENAQI